MICIRLVVEGRDLGIAGLPIECDRFLERAIGLELHTCGARSPRMILQLGEQPSSDAEASRVWRNPHALDVGWSASRRLHDSTPDGLPMEPRQD